MAGAMNMFGGEDSSDDDSDSDSDSDSWLCDLVFLSHTQYTEMMDGGPCGHDFENRNS